MACHAGPSPGLVPKCPPGTFRAWVEAAQKHRVVGVIFATYDDNSRDRAVGIRTRPELVDEIRQCSRELGLTRPP